MTNKFKQGDFCYHVEVTTNLHIIKLYKYKIKWIEFRENENCFRASLDTETVKFIRTFEEPGWTFVFDPYGESDDEQIKSEYSHHTSSTCTLDEEYLTKEELTKSYVYKKLEEAKLKKEIYDRRIYDSWSYQKYIQMIEHIFIYIR